PVGSPTIGAGTWIAVGLVAAIIAALVAFGVLFFVKQRGAMPHPPMPPDMPEHAEPFESPRHMPVEPPSAMGLADQLEGRWDLAPERTVAAEMERTGDSEETVRERLESAGWLGCQIAFDRPHFVIEPVEGASRTAEFRINKNAPRGPQQLQIEFTWANNEA